MPTDPQPEEAATKVPAAAASAVGSYVQTQMYGRGFRQRADSTKPAAQSATDEGAAAHQESSEPEAPATAADEPRSAAEDAPDQPPHEQNPHVLSQILDEGVPAETERSRVGEVQPARGDMARLPGDQVPSVGAEEAGEVGFDEVALACEMEDSAAAQARLVRGQVEPPGAGVAVPAPGLVPGMVPGL